MLRRTVIFSVCDERKQDNYGCFIFSAAFDRDMILTEPEITVIIVRIDYMYLDLMFRLYYMCEQYLY